MVMLLEEVGFLAFHLRDARKQTEAVKIEDIRTQALSVVDATKRIVSAVSQIVLPDQTPEMVTHLPSDEATIERLASQQSPSPHPPTEPGALVGQPRGGHAGGAGSASDDGARHDVA